MLHTNTVSPEVYSLIKRLLSKDYLKDSFLVGGTALALHIGHRKSIDIDLFTTMDFNQELLLQKLENDFEFEADMIENNTIRGSSENIKVDILTHAYPLIEPVEYKDEISLASIRDIAAMKLNAISLDGSRVKDFIDIYFLLNHITLDKMLNAYKEKYSQRNTLHALKSLQYFNDVEPADWPEIISDKNLKWEIVKKKIDQSCKTFIRSELS